MSDSSDEVEPGEVVEAPTNPGEDPGVDPAPDAPEPTDEDDAGTPPHGDPVA